MADEINMKWAEDVPAFRVEAFVQGDPGSEFRMRNDPGMDMSNPIQRTNVTERRGRINVACTCKYIVHGREKDGGGAYYSLIALESRFDPHGSRRIKTATIALQFSKLNEADPTRDPKVVAIAPEGFFCLAPTTEKGTRTTSGGLTVGATPPVASVQLTANLEETVESDRLDAATLRGAMETRGRQWGDKNTAVWQLCENRSATPKFGVATRLTAVILVEREDDAPFRASVTIEIQADARTELQSLFSRRTRDDDVFFNPKRPIVGSLGEKYINNLASYPPGRLANVTYQTILTDTIQHKVQGGSEQTSGFSGDAGAA